MKQDPVILAIYVLHSILDFQLDYAESFVMETVFVVFYDDMALQYDVSFKCGLEIWFDGN